jgi:hypothetical protein
MDFFGFFDEDDAEFYDTNEETGNTSLYSFTHDQGSNFFKRIFGDTSLKIGIIIKTHEIDDENNLNKKIPEYDVLIVQEDDGAIEPVVYKNCINTDSFGGKADFFEYKLRSNSKEAKGKNTVNTNFEDQDGNVVLLLCLDGSLDKGVILKSIFHKGRKDTSLTKDAGIHMEGEYNGVNWQINKDGELTVTFKSKTDNDGKPEDETAGGTTLKMDKEGSVDINTNLEEAEETYIRMDKKNKDVGLKAGANIGFTAKKDVATNADGKITGKAKGSIEFAAEGTAKLAAKSSLTLEGESEVTVKGGTLTLDTPKIFANASEIFLSGKVYVGDGGAPAIVQTTLFKGDGNHGAPVISQALGPFSSSVFIAP